MTASVPEIAVVAPGERELRLFRRLLEHAGIAARTTLCRNTASLGAGRGRGGFDLVAWWGRGAPVEPAALRRFAAGQAQRPALVVVVETPVARDYVAADELGAGDVIDCGNPARAGFALRRELRNADLRRRLDQARHMLEQERVIDEQALEPPPDTGTIPPLVRTIDRALEQDLFEILYQPIVSLRGDAFESHEVFVRIPTPEGPLLPGDFLPIAGRYGLLPAIDRRVVARAVERFSTERAGRAPGERPLRFFLNVSAATLVESPSVRAILHLIADAGPEPGSFVIEVDKKTILSRLRLAQSLNDLARRLHLQFAIDHFDVSDARLNYTRHVSVDYLKLNRSLVEGIERSGERRREITAVCERARAAGIRVIASQVERMAELAPLYDAGVDYVQGFLVAEPSERVEHGAGASIVLESVGAR